MKININSYFGKNVKGFTLIELLAVIVILAILALIVSPIISGVISDAKKASAERSIEGYIKAVEYAQVQYQYKNGGAITSSVENLTVSAKGIDKITVNNIKFNNSGIVETGSFIVDGYNCTYNNNNSTNAIYVNKKPSTYANYTDAGTQYYSIGYSKLNSDGWISKMNYDANNPFIQLPKIASGSETTKYADYYYGTILGNTVMRVGGPWTYTTKAGLSSFDAFTASPDPYYNTGARLLKKPL